jgi:hypothetical protein
MVAVFLSFIIPRFNDYWMAICNYDDDDGNYLAGIVVNNGVVLLDYTELLLSRKKEELSLPEDSLLDKEYLLKPSWKARLRPVLLTAITTVLG